MGGILNKRLRQARKRSGLSQSELAVRVKVQPAVISHFETGKRSPSLFTLRLLADALDVSLDYLFGRTDDPAGASGPIGNTPLAKMHRKMQGWSRTTQEDILRFAAFFDRPMKR